MKVCLHSSYTLQVSFQFCNFFAENSNLLFLIFKMKFQKVSNKNYEFIIEFIFQEHRTIKLHRVNKLVQSKKHLWNIHIDRICIQHETHIWLKNFLVLETLPEAVVRDIFTLCISQYSEVRSYSQDLLFKILNRYCLLTASMSLRGPRSL